MFDYNIQERVDLFVEVGAVQAACLPARAFCTASYSQMKCFMLAAELQLLHEVGLTTASAAWLLFNRMQPRAP